MLKKYLLNTSGNFGVMFSLCATALVMGVGVAVDYAGMTSQRSKLQNYIDAAVLAAVTADIDDMDELQKIVDERIALLNVEGWQISAPLRMVGDDLVIDASTKYDAVLMGPALKLLGNDTDGKMNVGTSTAAPMMQDIPINIALVLDTTDSMEGANIEALKDAAEALLIDLEDLGDDVKVSIVPFGQYVNILSQEGEIWLDTSLNGTIEYRNNEPYETADTIAPAVCTKTGKIIPGKNKTKDGVVVCKNPDYEEQSCTDTTYGPKRTEYRNYELNSNWNGCAGSRTNGDNDKAAYDGVQIPGVMEVTYSGDLSGTAKYARCGDEMMPLNNDFTKMKSLINGLSTSGDTYLPSGLMWGWRALTPSVPFTQAASPKEGTITAMVLMTDGFNTRSQAGEYHDGGDKDAGLTLAETLCENVKGDGIDMYTVAYNMPTVADAKATQDMLRKCASSSAKNYDPKDAAQLKAAFKEIANSLKTVRLKYRPS